MKTLVATVTAGAAVGVITTILVLGESATDREPISTPDASNPVASFPTDMTSHAEAPSDGTDQAIRVHGHWVIEVRDPDGSLAERAEFDNALTTQGASGLRRVLLKQEDVRGWNIMLSSDADDSNPCTTEVGGGNPVPCWLIEADVPVPATQAGFTFNTLSVGGFGVEFLAGQATAARDGQISRVQTKVLVVNRGAGTNGSFSLTQHELSPAIDVFAGQAISVTVTISFS